MGVFVFVNRNLLCVVLFYSDYVGWYKCVVYNDICFLKKMLSVKC